MRRALLAALVAVLVVPAGAQAVDRLPRFMAEGVNVWGHGTLPRCGTPTINFTTIVPGQGGAPAGGAIALARIAACQIDIDSAQWARLHEWLRCVVILHEVGHLYGMAHRDKGVMQPSPDLVDYWKVPACRRAMTTQPKGT